MMVIQKGTYFVETLRAEKRPEAFFASLQEENMDMKSQTINKHVLNLLRMDGWTFSAVMFAFWSACLSDLQQKTCVLDTGLCELNYSPKDTFSKYIWQ